MKSILNLPHASGVYIIENTKTKQSYIGSSVNIKKRCNAHRCALMNDKHANTKLQRSYNKYGSGVFSFRVLEATHPDKIIDAERKWIGKLHPYFNLRIVVESNRGVKLSELTRKRMSDAHKKRELSEVQLVNLHRLHKNRIGKPVTGKVKEALKLGPKSLIGKEVSQETREKIRQSKLGRKFNKETRRFECK